MNAFRDDSAPSYLLRDRDQVYGQQFRHHVKGMRIEEVLTAPHSPWQNPFAERLTVRSAASVSTTFLSSAKDTSVESWPVTSPITIKRAPTSRSSPDLRPIVPPEAGQIVEIPEVGGLHHRYLRRAA